MAETVKKLEAVSADERHFHNAESRRLSEWAYQDEIVSAVERGRAEGMDVGSRRRRGRPT